MKLPQIAADLKESSVIVLDVNRLSQSRVSDLEGHSKVITLKPTIVNIRLGSQALFFSYFWDLTQTTGTVRPLFFFRWEPSKYDGNKLSREHS